VKLFGGKKLSQDTGELVAAADAFRDAGSFAAAADAYAVAIAIEPRRADLRVQLGNMLKDSGKTAQAVDAYKQALVLAPNASDTYLQLGHALKMLGRRPESRQAYQQAMACPGGSAAAEVELIALGETQFLAQPGRWGTALAAHDVTVSLSIQLAAVKEQLLRIETILPGLGLASALPAEGWPALRKRIRIPSKHSEATILFVIDASRLQVRDAHTMAISLFNQDHGKWTARFIDASPQCAAALERLAVADNRIALSANIEQALVDAPATIILVRDRTLLQESAAGWFATCAMRSEAVGFTCDSESVTLTDDGYTPHLPIFRGISDPEALEESDCAGELLAVPLGAARAALQSAPTDFDTWFATAALALARDSGLGHIPLPLARVIGGSTDSGHKMPIGHREDPKSQTSISVIIPTRDNGPDVLAFVESLLATAASHEGIDVLIVDNGSVNPAARSILETLGRRERVRVIRRDEPFNWGQLNNEAAKEVTSDLVVFANDDMVMRTQGWDAALRKYLLRPEIGALGVKLCYPDGFVQHGGMLGGWKKRLIHDALDAHTSEQGPNKRWARSRRTVAITGAFLALRRDLFQALGGFDASRFAISFGDVDLCFRLREMGLACVWTPQIEATHYETKSRGTDLAAPEKHERDQAEWIAFRTRWGAFTDRDPSMSPWWVREGRPFRLLQIPNLESIEAYIQLTSGKQPWRIVRTNTEADTIA
jgi:O-antigen biosynthesis protein